MRRVVFSILCTSFSLGCNRGDISADISELIDESVACARGEKSPPVPIADLSIGVAEAIYSIPDPVRQVRCFVLWQDRLMSCETREMGYKALGDYLNNVCNIFATSIAFGLERVHAEPEVQLEVRLRLVMRLKEELDRIRPTRRRNPSHASKSQSRRQRYEEWRRCYLSLYRLHRLALDSLEEYDFPDMTKHLTQSRRDAIQHSLEARLGRAIRTRDVIQAETDTEEYKSVVSRLVEPEF